MSHVTVYLWGTAQLATLHVSGNVIIKPASETDTWASPRLTRTVNLDRYIDTHLRKNNYLFDHRDIKILLGIY